MAILFPTESAFTTTASLFSIKNQDTDQQSPFILNAEQRLITHVILSSPPLRYIILKGRQVGVSTLLCLLDVMVAIINPKTHVAIVSSKTQASQIHLRTVVDFLAQFGHNKRNKRIVKLTSTYVELNNGSRITAFTPSSGKDGSESDVLRGETIGLLHITELPFWSNQSAYDSIIKTAVGSPIIIETTAKGHGDKFSRLYFDQSNEFKKLFFSIEAHENYTADPTLISDDVWLDAQEKFSFTSRPHAAWWYGQLKSAGGDVVKHLHDYPVIENHSFLTFEGRWINHNPSVMPYHMVGEIEVYEKAQPDHAYVAAVDTSTGTGKDSHAIAVLDRTTRKLVACWVSNEVEQDEVVTQMRAIQSLYNPNSFIVESNGVGNSSVVYGRKEGLNIRKLTANQNNKYDHLLLSKQYIEAGILYGPNQLMEEVSSLYRNKAGKFMGRKDLIITCGFALADIEINPHIIPRHANRELVYVEPDVAHNPYEM